MPSAPFRAVPTTRNSPESSRICEMTRRMNALSSTTSTVRLASRGSRCGAGGTPMLEDTQPLLQRSHFYPAIAQVEDDAAPVVAAGVLGDNGHAPLREHLPHSLDVTLSDVAAVRIDEVCKHARPADELCAHSSRVRAQPGHFGEQNG